MSLKAKKNLIKFLLFIAFCVLCFYFGKTITFSQEFFKSFFSDFPFFLSAVIYIILYVVLTFFIWFGPKDVFRIAAAVIFGAYASTALVWISEMINAAILFQFSRKLGQGFVKEKFKLTDEAIEKAKKNKGFITTLAIRINPIFPFRLMDIGAGLSKISFSKYFWACFFGSPFRIFWLQYILAELGGDMKRMFDMMAKGPGENQQELFAFAADYPGIFLWSYVYFGVVILISLMALTAKIVQRFKKQSP